MDDWIEQLTQLQRYARALQEAIGSAEAHAPTQSTGIDQSRSVQVVLGGDGNFGNAVLEACQAPVEGGEYGMTERPFGQRRYKRRAGKTDSQSCGLVPLVRRRSRKRPMLSQRSLDLFSRNPRVISAT